MGTEKEKKQVSRTLNLNVPHCLNYKFFKSVFIKAKHIA